MPQQTLANRVESLERRMDGLEGLSDRVASLELQISQFREEVRLEFSAVRDEISDLGKTLRDGMHSGMDSLAKTLRDEWHDEMNSLADTLRGEIRAGDEETRRQMRVLHEDVISRLALLDEHLNGKRRSSGRRTRKGQTPRAGAKRRH